MLFFGFRFRGWRTPAPKSSPPSESQVATWPQSPSYIDVKTLCYALFWNMKAREQETKNRIEKLMETNAQGVAEFTHLALYELAPELTPEEEDILFSILRSLHSEPRKITPKNIGLLGIQYDAKNNMRKEFTVVYRGTYRKQFDLSLKLTWDISPPGFPAATATATAFRSQKYTPVLWNLHCRQQLVVPDFSMDGMEPCVHGGGIIIVVFHFSEALDIMSGLDYLHGLQLVHGNLKSENVLVSNQGVARLTDFGLYAEAIAAMATRQTQTATRGGNFPGLWTAPEVLQGDRSTRPTSASDIWAFGCLLYLITCRRTPYYHHDTRRPGNLINAIVVERELPLRPTMPDLNTDLIGDPFWGLITLCLSWDPASRLRSWTEIRASIRHLRRSSRPEEMLSPSADFWGEMKRDSNVRISFDFQAVRDLLVKVSGVDVRLLIPVFEFP
ncbi:RAC-gamma serine/threonine-protein kinase [Leucoagaricus sp. SymC.cos]|nr:RAC-gamma serine/threonine-protein kinase [Leucoagaricus sp. SymC.cos]